ncbi:MAG: phosphoenolpyruvate--protein phosphotransferase [Ruthenibacterium sp.]
MLTLQGYGTSFGVADGPLYRYISPEQVPLACTVTDCEAERARLDAALAAVRDELQQSGDDACARDPAADDTAMLELQCTMLADVDFLAAVRCAVEQHSLCAEYAVYSTGKAYAAKLHALDDAYLSARGDDVMSAAQRVVRRLSNEAQTKMLQCVEGRVVLAADTLLPGQALQLDHSKIAAFILREGAQSSLTAIWARSLCIPTVTGLSADFDKLEAGVRTMVDGETGLVVQSPDTPTMSQLVQKRLHSIQDERRLGMLRGVPAQTADGVTILLTANIALPADAKMALSCDAEGIGLFRSELLYLQSRTFPDEDTLYRAYCETLLMMGGKRVVVRLLDSSTDKSVFCPDLPQERNPALGVRPIPYGLSQSALLEPQLRALLRASAYGNLAILLPMVISAQEVRAVKDRIGVLRKQLRTEHKLVNDRISVGALIETPAAAATADLIAAESDFLSIGTNDLTQYVLVTDRTSTSCNSAADSHHPAVLRTIAQVVSAAHTAKIPVSICGESASDISLAGFYAGLRVTELSMAPACILKMKRAIRALTEETRHAALKSCLQIPHDISGCAGHAR